VTAPMNGVPESGAVGPATQETRPLYWSVRRELWENRFLYLAPSIVAVVVTFASVISTITTLVRRLHVDTLDPARQYAGAVKAFQMAPAPIMLATFIVGMFYSLDALFGERRDRSILFWKSLPVSDATTVLSKALIPIAVLPVIGFVLSVIAQLILIMAGNLVVVAHGTSPVRLWSELHFIEGLPVMIYGLAVHALWFAPIYGFLLLVSAWARRAPFLWAVLPSLMVVAVEHIAMGRSYFTRFLGYRVMGAMHVAFVVKPGRPPGDIDRIWDLTPLRFLSTSGLWIGLVFAMAFIAAAVLLRRNREPI
jgi:ABC-2 type transport system permease protein